MPQELPSPSGIIDHSAAGVTHVPSLSGPNTSTATPAVIQTSVNALLTSVCDSLLTSKGSTSTTPGTSDSISIVVVSSTPAGPVCTPSVTVHVSEPDRHNLTETKSTTSSLSSSHKYNLSQLVGQDKDTWFKHESTTVTSNSGLELEPPRGENLSVRRRSRQFFTLVEEDEVDSDTLATPEPTETSNKEPEAFLQVDPIFNLGDSLRRLYYPKEYLHHRKKKHRAPPRKPANITVNSDNEEERERSGSFSGSIERPLSAGHEKESDQGKMRLFDKIFLNPELRSYTSNPCVNEIPDVDEKVTLVSHRSKSLPTTPRVSPKLLRKKSVTETTSEGQGPGFSFLASVAGDVRLMKMKKEQELQKFAGKTKTCKIVNTSTSTSSSDVTVSKATDTTVAIKESGPAVSYSSDSEVETTHHHVSDFSEYLGPDIKSDKPKHLMKSLYEWGTKNKVKVTNKENNLFSPNSF